MMSLYVVSVDGMVHTKHLSIHIGPKGTAVYVGQCIIGQCVAVLSHHTSCILLVLKTAS